MLPLLPLYGLVILILAAFTGGASISLYLNAEFGASRVGELGRWIALVCDIFKIGLSTAFLYLRGWFIRFFALTGIVAFSLLSILSSYGYYVLHIEENRGSILAEQQKYRLLKEKQRTLKQTLVRLGHPRPLSAIAREIKAYKQDPVFREKRRSNQCRNATIPASRLFCEHLRKLEVEQETALDTHHKILETSQQLEETNQGLNAINLAVVSQRVDPFARSFGNADLVNIYFNLFLAVLIEIATTTGLPLTIFLTGVANNKRQNALKAYEKAQQQTVLTASFEEYDKRPDDPDGLTQFLDTITKDKDGFVTSAGLQRAYRRWLHTHPVLSPLNEITLGARLVALGFQRRRRQVPGIGRTTVYVGLTLE